MPLTSSFWFIMKTICFLYSLHTKLGRSMFLPNHASLAPCQRFTAPSKGRVPGLVDWGASARKIRPRLVLVDFFFFYIVKTFIFGVSQLDSV